MQEWVEDLLQSLHRPLFYEGVSLLIIIIVCLFFLIGGYIYSFPQPSSPANPSEIGPTPAKKESEPLTSISSAPLRNPHSFSNEDPDKTQEIVKTPTKKRANLEKGEIGATRVAMRLFGEKQTSGISLRASVDQPTVESEHLTTPINTHNVDLSENNSLTYHRPSSQTKLAWDEKPKAILIVKKWNDPDATEAAIECVKFLRNNLKIPQVFIEESAAVELQAVSELTTVTNVAQNPNRIDLILCLGGDGTVLHVSSLFQCSIPPIMAFNLGSMGFLSPFSLSHWREDIQYVMENKFFIQVRFRIKCIVFRRGEEIFNFRALNEAVIDRGSSPYLTRLHCYCDDKLITTVQADGIIISTTTGSTAYSLSAGGSLVHPMIPAILFTPICPHALSSRPVVLPSSCTLRIEVPIESACGAHVSFDGKHKRDLLPGDSIAIHISKWPVPTVSKSDQIAEWFQSLAEHLMWNQRIMQKENSKMREE